MGEPHSVYQAVERYANYPKPKIIILARPNARKICFFKIHLNTREQCTKQWFLLGPYRWQKKTGYHQRSLVETAMMR